MTDLDIVIKALRDEAQRFEEAADNAEGQADIAAMIFKCTGAGLRNTATRISNEQKTRQSAAGIWQNVSEL